MSAIIDRCIHYEEVELTRSLTRAEREHALASWCRVVGSDGATIAYVPDCVTAQQIVDALR